MILGEVKVHHEDHAPVIMPQWYYKLSVYMGMFQVRSKVATLKSPHIYAIDGLNGESLSEVKGHWFKISSNTYQAPNFNWQFYTNWIGLKPSLE